MKTLNFVLAALAAISIGAAQTPTTIYNFQGATDGAQPKGNLAISSTGVLYGTTYGGGTEGPPPCQGGCGTVYELTPPAGSGNWTKTILYNFLGGTTDGMFPNAGVILSKGTLYGTAINGGPSNGGIVFQLKPNGSKSREEVLFSFNPNSGVDPFAGLFVNSSGDLFGTTSFDGPNGSLGGTVFELTPPSVVSGMWSENLLATLPGYGNSYTGGLGLSAALISDKNGNLYGVTSYGGSSLNCTNDGIVVGCGMVYELQPPSVAGGPWTFLDLYSFQGGAAQRSGVTDGAYPLGALTLAPNGALYGVTSGGGSGEGGCSTGGCGTVFELKPPVVAGGNWTETVLYSFASRPDGSFPNGPLVLQGGELYGTTLYGGISGNCDTGCGTIFKLVPPTGRGKPWTEVQFFNFDGNGVGVYPTSGLTPGKNGVFYGVTLMGGTANCCAYNGTVYEFVP